MKPLTVFAAVFMIIIGGLMIIFYNGHIIVECIACGALLTRILGAVSIVLGVGTLISGRSAGSQ
jgi:hypothetical protein